MMTMMMMMMVIVMMMMMIKCQFMHTLVYILTYGISRHTTVGGGGMLFAAQGDKNALQLASFYDGQVFVLSDCLLDLGTDFLLSYMVFV